MTLCICPVSGISFKLTDSYSISLLVTKHPALAQLPKLNPANLPTDYLAAKIILKLMAMESLAYIDTYAPTTIGQANAQLAKQSPAQLIALLILVSTKLASASKLNLETALVDGQNIAELIKWLCGEEIEARYIPTGILVRSTMVPKVAKVSVPPRKLASMSINAIVARLPTIFQLVADIAPLPFPVKETLRKIKPLFGAYSSLDITIRSRLEAICADVLITGIFHTVFTVDSIEYKSLKYYIAQLRADIPQDHAADEILF